jgi:hypothetical protein
LAKQEGYAGFPKLAGAPVAINDLPPYVGEAWYISHPANTGMGQTAADFMKEVLKAHGGRLTVRDDVMAALAYYSPSQLVYVGMTAGAAKAHMPRTHMIDLDKGARVVLDDGSGGYLVLAPEARYFPLIAKFPTWPTNLAWNTGGPVKWESGTAADVLISVSTESPSTSLLAELGSFEPKDLIWIGNSRDDAANFAELASIRGEPKVINLEDGARVLADNGEGSRLVLNVKEVAL